MAAAEPENAYIAPTPVPEASSKRAWVKSFDEYQTMHTASLQDNDEFWGTKAKELVSWFRPFDDVSSGGFKQGDVAWFLNGKLNVSYNCLDRHLKTRGDQVAILWEGDEPGHVEKLTFRELHAEVCRLSNALLSFGVRKGDPVCIYLPMIPAAAVAMLACTRIGAPHSVVFAGFSAQALRDRIQDCHASVVLTADEGLRGGRHVPLKKTVDHALEACPSVRKCMVWQRTKAAVPMTPGRDVWAHEVLPTQRPFCPPVHMDAEDTMFLLYTSGSTGRPKGIAHTTGGYLVYAAATHKYVFDYHDGDVYACVADVGWITGHTYIVYGPLANGATTLMFESTPLYPNASRYWDMVARHKITQFYTAPTAIRAVQKSGDAPVTSCDRSSLRVLGTVGEPINPEAWKWYHGVVGQGKTPVVDTYWQTETGGIIVTPLPGATPLKPGSATFPFFGIELALLDKETGKELPAAGPAEGVLALKRPWPGMARTVFGDHQRYLDVYMRPFPGYYFTGDGARRDKDGYYFVTGRVDDVLSIAGHRLGTAEVESAVTEHAAAAEAAVVGIPDDIKGQAMFLYVILNEGYASSPELCAELKVRVREGVGAFASVKHVLVVDGLPKTRSGKIMRRLLRKIATRDVQNLGDVSTLADPEVVQRIMDAADAYYKALA